VRSLIEPNLVDNHVLFDNTTPINLINLLWKLGLDLKLHYFSIFHANFPEGNIVLKERTHSINNQMKSYILGVP